ncbi:MAG: hypothetical protein WC722_05770 [Rhodospirillales bacterium]
MQDADIKVQLLGYYAHLGADGLKVARLAYDWVFERGGHTQGVLQGHPSEPTSADVPPLCDITGQADGALQNAKSQVVWPQSLASLDPDRSPSEISKLGHRGGRNKFWSQERVKMLETAVDNKKSVEEIAALFGCTEKAIDVACWKFGIKKKKDASRQAGAKSADLAGRAAPSERKGDQATSRSDAPPSASAHPTTASGGVRGASNKQVRPASAGAGSAKAGSAAGIFLDVSSLDSPPAGTSPAGGAFSKLPAAGSDEEKVQDFLRRKGATTEAHYGEHHDVFVLMKGWGFGYVPASAKRFVTDPISRAQMRNDDYFALCRKECQRRNHPLPASLAEKSRRAAK